MSNKWKLLNPDVVRKILSKLAGEGSPSVPAKFKSAGWILSSWANRSSSKFQNFQASPLGQQFSRGIRQIKAKTSTTPPGSSGPFRQGDFDKLPSKFTNMDRFHYIFKPFAFTAFVGTSSIVGCTIWQYEEYRRSVTSGRFSLTNLRIPGFGNSSPQSKSSNEIIQKFDSWWSSLTPGEKIFWPICAINTAVWVLWRVPSLAPTMVTYFSATPVGRRVCLPMLLSTFSHYSLLHLCANMFVLHSFIPAAAQIMGKEQFLAMYLTSGTVASLGSHLHKLYLGNMTPSLGASGAIMGILGLVCTRMPDIQLGIIFLPGIQFTADTALKCILAVDVAGVLSGWKIMDHAAHLSGCLFGIAFSHYGGQTFWAFRDFVMTHWHKYRTQGV